MVLKLFEYSEEIMPLIIGRVNTSIVTTIVNDSEPIIGIKSGINWFQWKFLPDNFPASFLFFF